MDNAYVKVGMIQGTTISHIWVDELKGTSTVMTTPWQYLEDWNMSDRDHNTTLDMITKMKLRWPGNYVVVNEWRPEYGGHTVMVMKFADPADETWFKLKYT